MILEIKNGCFGYPKQDIILADINLSLEEGHILAILGPNGIGKTTLLKCMIGLLPGERERLFCTGRTSKH
ncbi:MAG: ATP-binding cassette domain-containing protein [Roseburia sp.]